MVICDDVMIYDNDTFLQLQRAHAVSDSTIGLCKLYVVTYYQDCRWQNGRLFDGGLKHFYSPLTHLGKL